MKRYVGTKVVDAKPMTRQEYNNFRGWKMPKDEDGTDKGYYIEYPDLLGRVTWMDKDLFERTFCEINKLTFSDALHLVRMGKKISRSAWNGKGMFVYYVPGCAFESRTDVAQKEFGPVVEYNCYLAIKTVGGKVSTWVPSINDVLAEDWCVVD